MYNEWFFLSWNKWNNSFSLSKRGNKKLYIPKIITIDSFEDIKIQDNKEKIAFEEYDFDWKIQTCYWLKNFYRINWKWKEIILFDNHNHAYYFWYEARNKGIIGDNNLLFHIDEHSDMKDDKEYLLKEKSFSMREVFDFTNNTLNVWNYIVPALKEWILSDVIQIRNQTNLDDYINWKFKVDKDIILNLDLDFFSPWLDYINYNLKKKVILDLALKAKVITISTSPFFIKEDLALEVLRDLFCEN